MLVDDFGQKWPSLLVDGGSKHFGRDNGFVVRLPDNLLYKAESQRRNTFQPAANFKGISTAKWKVIVNFNAFYYE